ncbi:hypothetical protein ACP3W1_23960, partial [Salmonella enterica]|uniref:hypothetical protein n=1 Tax=Salmonella enterica TaxID=28901 RepID=UPI003CF05D05
APASHEGLVGHYEFDGSLTDASGHYRYGRVVRGDLTYSTGMVGKAAEFDGDTHVVFGDSAALQPGKRFALAFWINNESHQPMSVLEDMKEA